jgi:amidase
MDKPSTGAADGFGSALCDLPARELRRLIGLRKVSPVEVMMACLSRIEALEPAVNALAATDFDRALLQARQAEDQVMRGEPLGLLHGLPLGVKDLQDTAGLLTTHGNIRWRGHVPASDASLVARLRAAGAIVTAKTNVPDMGAGANTRNPVWGATGNPFDPMLNAGGSSGGSAAALATGMLPLCTGSDTGGSLRIPAALCGVVGLRPSPGWIGYEARPLGWSPLSVLGPMACDIEDTALLMAASVGPHPLDPISRPSDNAGFLQLPDVDLRTLRVAWTADFDVCAVDPDIRKTFLGRVEAVERLCGHCEPVKFGWGDEVHRAFDVLRAEAFLAGHSGVSGADAQTLSPNVRANLEIARGMSLQDRANAHLVQTRMARDLARLFTRFDVLIAPVSPVTPFPWATLYAQQVDGQAMRNYYEWLALTYVVTLATNPALSLPCGRDAHGMPFGLQMIGPLQGDVRLLSSARAFEAAWRDDPCLARPRPDLSLLQDARPALKSIVTHPPGRPADD